MPGGRLLGALAGATGVAAARVCPPGRLLGALAGATGVAAARVCPPGRLLGALAGATSVATATVTVLVAAAALLGVGGPLHLACRGGRSSGGLVARR